MNLSAQPPLNPLEEAGSFYPSRYLFLPHDRSKNDKKSWWRIFLLNQYPGFVSAQKQ